MFAPIAKLKTINVLMSLVTNLERHQLEVMNAFLNTNLEEEV